MRVIEEVEVAFTWQDLDALTYHPRPQHVREPGVHVSQVIRYLAKELGKKWTDDDEMPLDVLLGMAWEETAARLYATMQWQPRPLKRDGLIGSPDGFDDVDLKLSIDKEPQFLRPVIDEFKLTRLSQYNFRGGAIVEWWPTMTQMMSYAAMDPRQPQLGRLHVCYLLGDYREQRRSMYRRYLIRFERAEIERNWAMIVKYRDKVEPETGGR